METTSLQERLSEAPKKDTTKIPRVRLSTAVVPLNLLNELVDI